MSRKVRVNNNLNVEIDLTEAVSLLYAMQSSKKTK